MSRPDNKKYYEPVINAICARLIACGIKFDQKVKIEENNERIILTHKENEDTHRLISNALACEGIDFKYLELATAKTWLFNKDQVWHIVSYPTQMTFQWNSVDISYRKQ